MTLTRANFDLYLYMATFNSWHQTRRIGSAVLSRGYSSSISIDGESQVQVKHMAGVAPPQLLAPQSNLCLFSAVWAHKMWGMATELMRTQLVFASKIEVRVCTFKSNVLRQLTPNLYVPLRQADSRFG